MLLICTEIIDIISHRQFVSHYLKYNEKIPMISENYNHFNKFPYSEGKLYFSLLSAKDVLIESSLIRVNNLIEYFKY